MAAILPAGLESSSDSEGDLLYSGEDPKIFLKKFEKDDSFKYEYYGSKSESTPNHVSNYYVMVNLC